MGDLSSSSYSCESIKPAPETAYLPAFRSQPYSVQENRDEQMDDTRPYMDEDWLQEKFDGDNVRSLADECDVAPDTIFRWLDQHGIRERAGMLTKICGVCGEEFRVREAVVERRKNCSPECRTEAQRNQVTVTCQNCGKSFNRKPAVEKQNGRTFCSPSCGGEYRKRNGEFDGVNNPAWKGMTIKLQCEYCGLAIERYKSHVRGHNFCSLKCRSNWYSENFSGEDSPHWRGGGPGYYGRNWPQQRKKTLQRDSFTCQGCGSHENELNESLRVHHIRRLDDFNEPEQANRLTNLVSLCRGCHRRWEGIHLRPTNYAF